MRQYLQSSSPAALMLFSNSLEMPAQRTSGRHVVVLIKSPGSKPSCSRQFVNRFTMKQTKSKRHTIALLISDDVVFLKPVRVTYAITLAIRFAILSIVFGSSSFLFASITSRLVRRGILIGAVINLLLRSRSFSIELAVTEF